MNELEARILGVTEQRHSLTNYTEISTENIAMASQARRKILIFSHQLEPRIYQHPDFINAVKNLAIRHEKTMVQLLIRDNSKIRQEGHRLIDLAQRLSSSFTIKKMHRDFDDVLRSYMLVDDIAYVFRPRWYEGKVAFSDFNAPAETKEYLHQFEKIWDASEVDTILRRL